MQKRETRLLAIYIGLDGVTESRDVHWYVTRTPQAGLRNLLTPFINYIKGAFDHLLALHSELRSFDEIRSDVSALRAIMGPVSLMSWKKRTDLEESGSVETVAVEHGRAAILSSRYCRITTAGRVFFLYGIPMHSWVLLFHLLHMIGVAD